VHETQNNSNVIISLQSFVILLHAFHQLSCGHLNVLRELNEQRKLLSLSTFTMRLYY